MANKSFKIRADGRYHTSVRTGKYDAEGKAIRVDIFARTITEMRQKVAAVRDGLETGTYADDKGIKFGDYADTWLTTYKSDTENRTFQKYKWILNRKITALRPMRLRDIEKINVQDAINAENGHPDNQRMIRLTVREVLDSAIDDGLIYKNVTRTIKLQKHQAKEKRPLTEDEKTAIKKCDFTPEEKLYVDILFSTGLRKSEVFGLMRNDIDSSGRQVHVRRSLDTSSGVTVIKDTKNHRTRNVEAPKWLFTELSEYMRENPHPYIFTGKNGAVSSYSHMKRLWESIYWKINVAMGGTGRPKKKKDDDKKKEPVIRMTDITPHIFRHNYATMLFYSGVNVKEAQRLLGHSSIKVTLGIYTHLQQDTETRVKIDKIAL